MKKHKIYLYHLLLLFLAACTANNNSDKTSENSDHHPKWSYNKTIYEVNVRQYTEKGNFEEFEKHLPRLKEMGIGIIWLMPIHPIGEVNRKGPLGSYYSVKDYKKINPNFGNEEDLKRLVKKTHDLGMYIIIDWIANHTAWDHPWTKTNKDFYTLDSTGNFVNPVEDWSDVIDLNYTNKDLWKEKIGALEYWIKEFDIDGYRCDMASMVPLEFWDKAISELRKTKNVFMLAEGHEPELHDVGFDMTYSWHLKDVMNSYAKGESSIEDFKQHFLIKEKEFPENAFRLNFTTNHDENSWNGTIEERLGKLAEPLSVLISTAPGTPLVYSGQEAGNKKALKFFEKDIITWQDHKQQEVFKILFNEKLYNQAFWNGSKGGDVNFLSVKDSTRVLAYYRKKNENVILVALNLSDSESVVQFNDESILGGYENLFSQEKIIIDARTKFDLPAYGYIVLVR